MIRYAPIRPATFYYWRRRLLEEDPDKAIKDAIRKLSEENPYYGVLRIHTALRRISGFETVNHKRVQRLMKVMGIQAKGYGQKTRKYNSYPGPNGQSVKNRLRRRFTADRRFQKLVSDVTEFKVPETGQKLYLEPIMDLYNREIVSYSLSTKPTLAFALQAVQKLLPKLPRRDYQTILHTDQGWQYRHRTWQKTLLQNGIKPSMSRKATALDNAVIESFFNKLKTEIGSLKQYKSRTELTKKIRWFIHDYNTNRIQMKLSGQSPIEYRQLAA